jgi:hypothetical protein
MYKQNLTLKDTLHLKVVYVQQGNVSIVGDALGGGDTHAQTQRQTRTRRDSNGVHVRQRHATAHTPRKQTCTFIFARVFCASVGEDALHQYRMYNYFQLLRHSMYLIQINSQFYRVHTTALQ